MSDTNCIAEWTHNCRSVRFILGNLATGTHQAPSCEPVSKLTSKAHHLAELVILASDRLFQQLGTSCTSVLQTFLLLP